MALKGDLKHFNNPVFDWMLQNVQIERNPDDQIKLNKKKSREKIDGPVALMNAMGAWLSDTEDDGTLDDDYEIVFS